jgi:hypothetical protein
MTTDTIYFLATIDMYEVGEATYHEVLAAAVVCGYQGEDPFEYAHEVRLESSWKEAA